jgi:hypothetical protein
VTPVSASHDVAYGLLTDAESFGNCCLWQLACQCTNRADILWRYFRRMVVNASWHSCPRCCIKTILFLRPSIKMFRVDARRIIAVMQHVQSLWNRANMMLIREPVRVYQMPIDDQVPIAIAVKRTGPLPAAIAFDNFSQKPHKRAYPWTRARSTRDRTIAADMRRLPIEVRSAGDAYARNHDCILAYACKPETGKP